MRDRLNCPLFYDPSRKVYFYKDDTFSLPLIYLSSEELSSLLIARKFLQDGSLELTFPVANFAEITMEILKHGAGVEVVKPKALREIIKEEAKKIAKIY
jgi:predicted DNA-binding transcriptional regulator YafY